MTRVYLPELRFCAVDFQTFLHLCPIVSYTESRLPKSPVDIQTYVMDQDLLETIRAPAHEDIIRRKILSTIRKRVLTRTPMTPLSPKVVLWPPHACVHAHTCTMHTVLFILKLVLCCFHMCIYRILVTSSFPNLPYLPPTPFKPLSLHFLF